MKNSTTTNGIAGKKSNALTVTTKQAHTLVDKANEIVVSLETQPLVESLLKGGKNLKTAINEHYDSFLNPLKEQIKVKEAERKGIIQTLDEAIKTLKNKLATFLDIEKQRKAEEAAKEAATLLKHSQKEQAQAVKKLIKEGKIDEAQVLAEAALPVIKPIAENVETGDGISSTNRLKYIVESIDKVPDYFFKPRELDTKKIWSAGYAGKEIPGIKFYREDSIMVRG